MADTKTLLFAVNKGRYWSKEITEIIDGYNWGAYNLPMKS